MSLSYTTGTPSNLTAGASASMNDIQGPFTDIKTWADAKFSAADLTTATLQTLGMTSGSQIGRGKTNISTLETRTNVAYGTLTTPDQVAGIVLPTDGLLHIYYTALWRVTSAVTASAAIFIGANQLKKAVSNSAPTVQETTNTGQFFGSLGTSSTSPGGLDNAPSAVSDSSNVTTGQIVGFGSGVCIVQAAAGTYTVSVQYKTSSGTVEVKNRLLWVKAESFS